jgi:hypothetical protein
MVKEEARLAYKAVEAIRAFMREKLGISQGAENL